MTVAAAMTTGSTLDSGIEPCAPRPNRRTLQTVRSGLGRARPVADMTGDTGHDVLPQDHVRSREPLEEAVIDHGLGALDGLAPFCVTGGAKAIEFRLGPAQAIILGAITAIGGGMLRDVLIRQVPTVPRHDLYAVPALAGAAVLAAAHGAGTNSEAHPSSASPSASPSASSDCDTTSSSRCQPASGASKAPKTRSRSTPTTNETTAASARSSKRPGCSPVRGQRKRLRLSRSYRRLHVRPGVSGRSLRLMQVSDQVVAYRPPARIIPAVEHL